jgi:hypothetical protein
MERCLTKYRKNRQKYDSIIYHWQKYIKSMPSYDKIWLKYINNMPKIAIFLQYPFHLGLRNTSQIFRKFRLFHIIGGLYIFVQNCMYLCNERRQIWTKLDDLKFRITIAWHLPSAKKSFHDHPSTVDNQHFSHSTHIFMYSYGLIQSRLVIIIKFGDC